jgi:glycosyltransferase involved in cell wall biosynthesis
MQFILPLVSTAIFFSLGPLFCSRLVHMEKSIYPHYSLPVSILIPLYNREKYITRAILSAQFQTLRQIEILVVDDCSTDSSVALVSKIAMEDPRIRLVRHTRNAGTHETRVTAVQSAQGAFLLSLDPDDRLLPTVAEQSFRAAILRDVDIVEFEAIEAQNATGRYAAFDFLPLRMDSGSAGLLRALFVKRRVNWNIWKRLIRRETYLDALSLLRLRPVGRKIVYGEDKFHIGLVFLVANAFVHLQEVGYVYYTDISENSESGTEQNMLMCMSQLRHVERLLRTIYRATLQMEYRVDSGIPTGFMSKVDTPARVVKKRRRRGRAVSKNIDVNNVKEMGQIVKRSDIFAGDSRL